MGSRQCWPAVNNGWCVDRREPTLTFQLILYIGSLFCKRRIGRKTLFLRCRGLTLTDVGAGAEAAPDCAAAHTTPPFRPTRCYSWCSPDFVIVHSRLPSLAVSRLKSETISLQHVAARCPAPLPTHPSSLCRSCACEQETQLAHHKSQIPWWFRQSSLPPRPAKVRMLLDTI
jgi:hypothetical protein